MATCGAMNTDMSAFMGLSPNKDLKNGLIRAESVFMSLYGSVFGKRDLMANFSQARFQRKFPFKRCKTFKNIPDRI